jgi:Leucine-rich repeat (LRR) protein
MISYVENGTFAPLQDLQVIRLSYNALNKVPAEILQLPKLRKIFMDGNRLTNGGGFIGAPASESLESLTLANCHLKELPPLDMYLNLLELNISGNDLKRILPQQLAPMCQLHWLDISGNPRLSEDGGDGCDCHLLTSWIKHKNIVLQKDYKLNCTSKKHGKTIHIMSTFSAI